MLTFDAFSVRVVGPTGALTERVLNGTEAVQNTGSESLVTRATVVDVHDAPPSTDETRVTVAMNGRAVFTPDVVSSGTASTTSGSMALSGEGTLTGPDGAPVHLSRESDPSVHWNAACMDAGGGQPFDSGTVTYRTTPGTRTSIGFETCTSSTRVANARAGPDGAR